MVALLYFEALTIEHRLGFSLNLDQPQLGRRGNRANLIVSCSSCILPIEVLLEDINIAEEMR
jgi:hypothetical protein